MSLPETFSSIKAKMNSNVSVAVEAMNKALLDIINDDDVKPRYKLKYSQEYLALYMRLENEIMKQAEHREMMKQRKLNTRIKAAEVAEKEESESGVPTALKQSKFSPSMTVN